MEVAFTDLMCAAAAAIFVATTLATRRKDYRTLRTLGVSAGAVSRLVVADAALLAAIGLAIGRIVGAAMATLSIQMLAPLFSAPPNSWTSPPWAQRPVSPS
jgi:predicted lysophospholipase L1 biosynthesis ABC-type transport system permease subunit